MPTCRIGIKAWAGYLDLSKYRVTIGVLSYQALAAMSSKISDLLFSSSKFWKICFLNKNHRL